MARFKILSDFDGVWTHQGLEAEEVQRWIVEESARLLGDPVAEIDDELQTVHARMMAQPHAWGWAPDGSRISAYVDEDPLCRPSGLCLYIDRATDVVIGRYRAAICEAFGSMAKFGEHCYRNAMVSYRVRHPPAIDSDAAQQLQAVVDAGAEVVVVSNSPASKIGEWFQAVGIDAGEGPEHALRLRGSAGKQTLGTSNDSIDIGGRRIIIDRPLYRAAIEEENPDLIIGDVFSLDLALPHVMRVAGVAAAPTRLALRAHPHTPSWVLDTRAGGAIDNVVDSFGAIAALVS